MSNLLTLGYWLELSPRELMPLVKTILFFAFDALIAAGFVARHLAARANGAYVLAEGGRRFGRFGITMGVLGLLLLFFTHELTYFFGARFWYLVWLLAAAVWFVLIVRALIRDVPQRAAAYAERERIQKWLPKSR